MRLAPFIAVLLFFSGSDATSDPVYSYAEADVKPAPEYHSLYTVTANARYPQMAWRARIGGTVAVQAVVTPQGRTDSVRVLRGIGGGCDEEAFEAIRALAFTPGQVGGQPVSVRTHLAVQFDHDDAFEHTRITVDIDEPPAPE